MMPDNYMMPPTPPPTWPVRLAGVAVLLVCGLLLACLLTYHVEEVGWSALNPAGHGQADAHPCTNLLGVCGMYVAGFMYWALGLGALYGVCLTAVPAAGMLLWPESRRTGQWWALSIMLMTSCASLAVQPWLLTNWAEAMALTTPGGKLGYLYGPCMLEALMGKSWSLSLLLLVHAIALIYFARYTPWSLYQAGKRDVIETSRGWLDRRRRARDKRKDEEWKWQRTVPEPDNPPTQQRVTPRWRERDIPAREPELPLEPVAQPRRAVDDEPPRAAMPPQAAALPPRRRVARALEEEPLREEAPAPAPQLRQPAPRAHEEPQPREEAPAPTTPQPRQPAPRAARVPRAKSDNILDLLEQVEDEIERENYVDDTLEEVEEMPLNAHTQEAIKRRFGGAVSPAAPPPARKESPARRAPSEVEPPSRKPAPSAPVVEPEDYPMPPYELLRYEPVSPKVREAAQVEMEETQAIIADTLESFRISVQLGEITRGPSVTRYEFSVPRGQSVKAVAGKRNDLMAATQSPSVNILAPIPGKSTVGIELENSVKEAVYLRELLQSEAFHNPKIRIPVALGKDVYGNPVIGDLAAMPHVLVAGSTGSGKSVCINSMLISMLYKFRPDELKLVLVDPKVVEMQPYKKLPHLAVPVVVDPGRVIGALRWAVNEMERRYKFFSKTGVRNLEDFNNRPPDALLPQDEPEEDESAYPDMRTADAIVREVEDSQGADIPEEDELVQGELDYRDDEPMPTRLPYIVIVIDELADLMMQVKEDLENYIGRLTQKARAAGIHLIVATQSPRAQVVTGIIKTNLPSRIALKVTSQLDSRVILDEGGAENLLGRGDLLFLPPGGPSKMTRAQGAFVSDDEISSIIQFCAAHAKQNFVQSAAEALNESAPAPGSGGKGGRGGYDGGGGGDSLEELYTRCVNMVVTERKASTSLLQRRFRIGYGKAAEIMDLMEQRGVISPANGTSRPREVLIEAPE